MVAEAFYLVPGFLPDVLQKLRRGWVKRAREHKIVPEKQSLLVAEIVKVIALILSAAPDAEHVHVRLLSAGEEILEHDPGLPLWQGVTRNPVGTLDKDLDAVHAEPER